MRTKGEVGGSDGFLVVSNHSIFLDNSCSRKSITCMLYIEKAYRFRAII
jgi:hypothetical protein